MINPMAFFSKTIVAFPRHAITNRCRTGEANLTSSEYQEALDDPKIDFNSLAMARMKKFMEENNG